MGNAQVDYNAVRGNLKDVFAGYENACPEELVWMREMKFDGGDKNGDEYQYGVELARPQGFTTMATGSFNPLNAPVSRIAQKARLQPWQMYLRERITYDILSRCMESKQAARTELGATVESMRDAIMFRQEALSCYGQSNLGLIGTVTGDNIVLTSATWAPGLWAGNEGARLSIRSADGTTAVKDVTLSYVDFDSITLNLSTGDGAGIAVGNSVWFEGGSPTTELAGFRLIMANTGSLYNINAATYSLWKGVQYNMTTEQAGSDLTFRHAIRLDARIRSRGGGGENKGDISPDVFTTLVNTIEGARSFSGPEQYKPTEITRGTQELTFYSPLGKTSISPHPMVKRGDYFSRRVGKFKRVGATDPTFNLPGGQEQFGMELQDYPGRELRCMANNTIFTPRPAASGYISNITFGGTATP